MSHPCPPTISTTASTRSSPRRKPSGTARRDEVAERATEHAGDPYDLTPEENEEGTISSDM
ncbi:hypothetical protein [Nonomuraea dietziae]|uniref:hypothetical protein n=1 Tax=Nonomuraea dietziae TaxID=65515 RepID=UPI0033DDCB45